MAGRTPDELKAAVDSMFRIRAVESPPDERGVRTIWHRGLRGAELVTEVDRQGRVLKQDFTLFGHLVRWEPGDAGFVVYRVTAKEANGPLTSAAALEPVPSHLGLEPAALALQHYEGADRYLLHLKDRVVGSMRGESTEDPSEVTGTFTVGPPQPPAPAQRRTALVVGLIVAVVLCLIILLGFAASRAGW